MSVLLFLSPAHADADAMEPECSLVTVTDTLPGPEAVGVPLDVSPAALFWGDCDGPDQWTLEITEDGEVVASDVFDFDWSGRPQQMRLHLDVELAPDTDYELRVVPGEGGYSEPATVGFTTGTELSGGLSGDPLITEAEAWFYDFDTSVEVGGSFTVSPAIDADGLSLLHFVDEDGEILQTRVVGDGEVEFTAQTTWATSAPTEDICYSVFQEDAAGLASAVETVCVGADERFVEEDRRGCSTGGLAPTALFGLIGLLGLRRRR
ncbi:MAG TPA: hypothetical protein QGF58_11340 [Myxococcota bacterium]|nr:hypothetical protein [Myxococcota bacterium]